MTSCILSLAKKMVILDIYESHSALVCVEAKSSFIEKIQAHQL